MQHLTSQHTRASTDGALWINPQSVPEMVPIDVKQQYRSYASSRDQLNDPSALAQLTPTEIQELRSRFLVEENQWQRVQEEYPGVDIAEADVYPDRLLQNATRLSSNFNTQETLRANYRLGKVANDYLLRQPIDAIVSASQSLSITVPTMFRSIYTQWGNAFNTTFPGVNILDWIFSGWRFGLLIATSAAIIIRHLGIKGTATMMRRYAWFAVFWVLTLIPVLLSNRYWPPDIPEPTHSEADRLRALVDIPVYVLITVAGLLVVNRLRRACQHHTMAHFHAKKRESDDHPVITRLRIGVPRIDATQGSSTGQHPWIPIVGRRVSPPVDRPSCARSMLLRGGSSARTASTLCDSPLAVPADRSRRR